MFQFQNGAVKSFKIKDIFKVTLEFQFQNGAVKSRCDIFAVPNLIRKGITTLSMNKLLFLKKRLIPFFFWRAVLRKFIQIVERQ